jgi:GTP-binding protein SAR1
MVSYIKNFFKSVLSYVGLYQKKANLLFLGLDNSGKSTLIYLLKTNRISMIGPTIYPHVEELKIGNIIFNTFDLGGDEIVRKTWKNYFPSTDGILFLVDSADVTRFPEIKEELDSILNIPELQKTPIAIIANKIDKNGAASEDEIKEALGIKGLCSKDTRPLELFMCSVIRKIGYSEALGWLSGHLKDN